MVWIEVLKVQSPIFQKKCSFLLISDATSISRLAPGFDIFICRLIENVQVNSSRPLSKENVGFVII